ncbi:MAG: hypothetical protein E7376_04815 [Clostridiales bacterium]|nr:hypothetical protein [Clostridiales bacterium]
MSEIAYELENLRWYYLRKDTGASLYCFYVDKKNKNVINLLNGKKTKIEDCSVDSACLESVGLDAMMVLIPGTNIKDYKKIDINILKAAMPHIYKKYVEINTDTNEEVISQDNIREMSMAIKKYIYRFNDKVSNAIKEEVER